MVTSRAISDQLVYRHARGRHRASGITQGSAAAACSSRDPDFITNLGRDVLGLGILHLADAAPRVCPRLPARAHAVRPAALRDRRVRTRRVPCGNPRQPLPGRSPSRERVARRHRVRSSNSGRRAAPIRSSVLSCCFRPTRRRFLGVTTYRPGYFQRSGRGDCHRAACGRLQRPANLLGSVLAAADLQRSGADRRRHYRESGRPADRRIAASRRHAKIVLIAGASGRRLRRPEALPDEGDCDVLVPRAGRRLRCSVRAVLPVDLTDRSAVEALGPEFTASRTSSIPRSTRPQLVAGWRRRQQIATNAAMFRNLLRAASRTPRGLRHVAVLQGTKAYGVHVRPIRCRRARGATKPATCPTSIGSRRTI